MAQLSYGSDQVMESMMEPTNILDSTARSYKTIVIGRGRRQQLVKSEGRFCMAFRLEGQSNQLCYRVWKELIPDALKRYKLIGDRLSKVKLEYFSNFRYVPSALKMKCDGSVLPGIVMDWINGKTLDSFLHEDWGQLSDVQRLTFIRDFYYMCYELRENGIAHGDLSCLNILVTPNRDLRLVDYDSLFVREMGRDYYQTTGGAPSFQHPERTAPKTRLHASLDDDNFSQLVIALSLWIAYFNPAVTQSYDESNLIFIPNDLSGNTGDERLRKLTSSKGWQKAKSYENDFKHITTLLEALKSVSVELSKVPSLLNFASKEVILSPQFYSLLDKPSATLPSIQKVAFCTACGNKFTSDEFDYCTACGTKRYTFNN